MRAYQKAENFDQPFTPSDLNTETNGLKVSITYAKDALATDPVTPDQPAPPSSLVLLSSPLSPSSQPPSLRSLASPTPRPR